MFPLVVDSMPSYASTDHMHFGWSQSNRYGGSPAFYLERFTKVMGRAQMLGTWSLTEEGWLKAWATLRSDHPELAAEIKQRLDLDEARRRSRDAAYNLSKEIEAEVLLARLRRCTFLGGYGMDIEIQPRAEAEVLFTRAGVWMLPTGKTQPFLHRPYAKMRALELSGGASRTGGGYVGGGFGTTAAVEGMAIAAALNSLTTKIRKYTAMRIEATDAELFFFKAEVLPKELEIRLAEPRAHIRTAAAQGSATVPSPSISQSAGFADQLIRLAELVEKGLLTDDEFATAKARLLSEQ